MCGSGSRIVGAPFNSLSEGREGKRECEIFGKMAAVAREDTLLNSLPTSAYAGVECGTSIR